MHVMLELQMKNSTHNIYADDVIIILEFGGEFSSPDCRLAVLLSGADLEMIDWLWIIIEENVSFIVLWKSWEVEKNQKFTTKVKIIPTLAKMN